MCVCVCKDMYLPSAVRWATCSMRVSCRLRSK